MAYVVQEPCVKCKYGDCVEACPVNCFYEGEECIDCNACVPACPVEAIVSDEDAEEKWITINAEFDFTEETRRESKDDVTHGPEWDESKA